MNGMRPAIVLDLFIGGLQVGRTLGAYGIPVYGIDRCDDPPGAFSRFVKVLDAPEDWGALCRYLLEFSRKAGTKPVLIPTSDYYVRFLCDHYDELSSAFLIPYPGRDLIAGMVRKIGLNALFSEHGIPTPRSLVIEKGVGSVPGEWRGRFPCILKPDYQDRWTGSKEVCCFLGAAQRCFLLERMEDLEATLGKVGGVDNMVLQEFIPGDGLYYYVGYRNSSGRMLASFVGKKVRTYPHTLGSETILESVHVPQVGELGERILHALNYSGPAGIDFKYDPRDGEFKVIEINCRIGLNDCYLSRHGVNIPLIYYNDCIGNNGKAYTDYPAGITWCNFFQDLDWMRDYAANDLKLWLSWGMDLLKGYDEYALFSWEDPRPFLRFMRLRMLRMLKTVNRNARLI